MKEYLYVFRGGDAARLESSPEEMQEHMQKWGAWIQKLTEQGKYLAGEPLENGGAVVRKAGEVITDGPYAEGNEIVGGYLLVKAQSLEEATEMSKQCPIFEHDGVVEVREIIKNHLP